MLATSLLGLALLAQTSSPDQAQPPALRLGTTVVPVEYSLALKLDPDKDDFSGTVKAVVDVHESVKRFWVNYAPKLTISSADLEANGQHFKARILPGGKDFAGFEFDAPLPTLRAHLQIHYTG